MPRVPERHLSRATVRCYAELNDFLPAEQRQRDFTATFFGSPSVKDLIESLGIPHPEVDLILLNGRSVGFDERVGPGDRIAVYPVFERFDISPTSAVGRPPLRETRFVADVHLGRLARDLRLLGFDTIWRSDLHDAEIMATAARDHRIILTRDMGILRHAQVEHGYFVRATEPLAQLQELVKALQLSGGLAPWTRCMACNGVLTEADPEQVAQHLHEAIRQRHRQFLACPDCHRVYWRGSHYDRMRERLARIGIEAG